MQVVRDAIRHESCRTNMLFEVLRLDDAALRNLHDESNKKDSRTME